MEAPACGRGLYTKYEIQWILKTAYTGFRAAVLRSRPNSERTVINTGFWGCGAYGGNRELMALLQLHAANLADVDELVFFSGACCRDFEKAQAKFRTTLVEQKGCSSDALVEQVVAMNFSWGISDGN